MKRSNVSIFVPHNGCPHKCSFCDQVNITGKKSQPSLSDVRDAINVALSTLKESTKYSEIAFFGGSFTAIDRTYMIELLKVANEYVRNKQFKGIRISTRPDAIDDDVLNLLKNMGVTSIELGAQSMDDEVLLLNSRGHTSKDVEISSNLIKKHGFSLGLQMMTGLYGSDYKKDYSTGLKLASLRPDTIRIYPTVIMKNTELYELYKNKKYVPMSLDKSIELCSELILLFDKFNINVIRVGLHDSGSLRDNVVAGGYHPAFRELCESRLIFNKCLSMLKNLEGNEFVVYVNPKTLSRMIGHRKENLNKFTSMGYSVKINADQSMDINNVRIEMGR